MFSFFTRRLNATPSQDAEAIRASLPKRLEKEVESRQRGQKSRRTKLNSRQYKLQAGGQEVGVLKDWDDGRVVLEIRLEDQKRREALVEMLKGEFANE